MVSSSCTLDRQVGGFGRYHYMPVPEDIANTLLEVGHKRILLHLGTATYRRALVSLKEADGWVVQIGLDVLKTHG